MVVCSKELLWTKRPNPLNNTYYQRLRASSIKHTQIVTKEWGFGFAKMAHKAGKPTTQKTKKGSRIGVCHVASLGRCCGV